MALTPLPNSQKVYVTGKTPDVRVPMRRIDQSPTVLNGTTRVNPPFYVYDTSGPYTDKDADIDIRRGLSGLRIEWIKARGDTEILPHPTSEFRLQRLSDNKAATERFPSPPLSRRANAGKCVTQCITPAVVRLHRRWNLSPSGKIAAGKKPPKGRIPVIILAPPSRVK